MKTLKARIKQDSYIEIPVDFIFRFLLGIGCKVVESNGIIHIGESQVRRSHITEYTRIDLEETKENADNKIQR